VIRRLESNVVIPNRHCLDFGVLTIIYYTSNRCITESNKYDQHAVHDIPSNFRNKRIVMLAESIHVPMIPNLKPTYEIYKQV
jgi:hypothetical protein